MQPIIIERKRYRPGEQVWFIAAILLISAGMASCRKNQPVTVSENKTFTVSLEDSLYIQRLEDSVGLLLGNNQFVQLFPLLDRIRAYGIGKKDVKAMCFYYTRSTFMSLSRIDPLIKIQFADSFMAYAADKSMETQFIALKNSGMARGVGNDTRQDSAIYFFIKAEKMLIDHPELRATVKYSDLYSNIATLYKEQYDYASAKDYYLKVIHEPGTPGQSYVVAMSSLAELSLALGDTSAAYPYLKQLLAHVQKTNNRLELIQAYQVTGTYFYYIHLYDSAAFYLNKGVALDPEGMMTTASLARIALRHGNMDSARYWINREGAHLRGHAHQIAVDQVEYMETLAALLKAEGNSGEAYEVLHKLKVFQAALIKERKDKQFLNFQKEETRLKAQKTLAAQNARLALQKTMTGAATAGGLFLCSGTGILLWMRFRRQVVFMKGQNLKLELDAIFSQMNPGFILKTVNPLRRLISDGDDLQTLDYIANLSKLMRSMLQRQRNGKVTLTFEQNLLKNYLTVQQQRAGTELDFEIRVTDDLDPALTMIPSLLIHPVVEYIVEHGMTVSRARITIDMELRDEYLEVNVHHSGTRLPVSEKAEDHALETLKQRIALYKKQYKQVSLDISEEDEKGGRITLIIPLLREEELEHAA